jgi:hypothetical protein
MAAPVVISLLVLLRKRSAQSAHSLEAPGKPKSARALVEGQLVLLREGLPLSQPVPVLVVRQWFQPIPLPQAHKWDGHGPCRAA